MSVIHDFRNQVEGNLTVIRTGVDRLVALVTKLQGSAGEVTPEDQTDINAMQKEIQTLADALNSPTNPIVPPVTDAGNIGANPTTNPDGTAPQQTGPGGGPGTPPTAPASPIDNPGGTPSNGANAAPAPLTGITNPPGATTAPDGFNNATAGINRGGTPVPPASGTNGT